MRSVVGHTVGGAVIGAIIASNVVGKEKLSEDHWRKLEKAILEFSEAVRKMKREGEPDFPQTVCKRGIEPTDKERKEYNVIDDLVEEMNKHDAENPDKEFRYFIHCNYSGLGMLNQTGQLEKDCCECSFNRGYRHVLWIPVDLEGVSRGINVGTTRIQKADITLVACFEKDCCGWDMHHPRHLHWITTRCFDVDYTESGKALMREC